MRPLLLIILLFNILFSILIFETEIENTYIVSKMFYFQVITFIGLFFLFREFIRKRKVIFYKSEIFLPVLCFITWYIICIFGAHNPYEAFFATWQQGILILIMLYTSFIIKTPRDIIKIFNTVNILGIAVAIYGILQSNGIDMVILSAKNTAVSFLGHQNYAAQVLEFTIPMTLFLFLYTKSPMLSIFYCFSLILQFIHLAITGCRGAWFGLIGGSIILIFLLVYSVRWVEFFKKFIKDFWRGSLKFKILVFTFLILPILLLLTLGTREIFSILMGKGSIFFSKLEGKPMIITSLVIAHLVAILLILFTVKLIPLWKHVKSPFTMIYGFKVFLFMVIIGGVVLYLLLFTQEFSIPGVVSLKEKLGTLISPNLGTGKERTVFWKNSMVMVKDHPIFGVGPENFKFEYPLYYNAVEHDRAQHATQYVGNPHNEYLRFLTELGFPGLIFFLWFLISLVVMFVKIMNRSTSSFIIGATPFLFFSILSICLHSFISFPLLNPGSSELFWITVGIFVWISIYTYNRKNKFTLILPYLETNTIRGIIVHGVVGLILIGCIYISYKPYKAAYHLWIGNFFFGKHISNVANFHYQRSLSYYFNNYMTWFRLAQNAMNQGEKYYPWAEKCLKNMYRLFPHFMNGLYSFGYFYQQWGKYNKAIKYYKEALRLHPHAIRICINLANCLSAIGRLDLAEQQYVRFFNSIESAEYRDEYNVVDLAFAYNNLANIYMKKGELDEAYECYKKSLDVFPYDSNTYINLGNYFYLKGEYKKAIQNYLEALKYGRSLDKAYMNLGVVYLQQRQEDLALEAFLRAVAINKKLPKAFYYIGMIYEHKKDFLNAYKFYRVFLKIAPRENEIVKEVRRKLTQFKSKKNESRKIKTKNKEK